MTESTELPPKPEVALALLQTALSVYVHLDPRPQDVHVPSWLKKQPQLVLQVGMNMAVAIPDLDVGEEALSCTLSFNRRPEFCRIPWTAIYGLVGDDGRGMIWPDSIPPEVAAAAEGRAAGPKKDAPKKDAKRRLRAVSSDEGSSDDATSDEVATDDAAGGAAGEKSVASTDAAASAEPAAGEAAPARKKAGRGGRSAASGSESAQSETSSEGRKPLRAAPQSRGESDSASASEDEARRQEEAARNAAVTAGIFETETDAPEPKRDEGAAAVRRTDKEPAGKKERPAYLRLVK